MGRHGNSNRNKPEGLLSPHVVVRRRIHSVVVSKEEEEEEESDHGSNSQSSQQHDDDGRDNRRVLELLSRADSSRKLTDTVLKRNQTSRQLTETLLKRERSIRSLDLDMDTTSMTLSSCSSSDGDDDYGEGQEEVKEEVKEEDGSVGTDEILTTMMEEQQEEVETANDDVEDLLLRVETFHRSTRSFLNSTTAGSSATSTDDDASDSGNNSMKSFSSSSTTTTTTTTTTNDATRSSTPSSSDDTDPDCSSLILEKTRLELMALKLQGLQKRQYHQEQRIKLKDDLEEKSSRLKSKMMSLLHLQEDKDSSPSESSSSSSSNDDDEEEEEEEKSAQQPLNEDTITTFYQHIMEQADTAACGGVSAPPPYQEDHASSSSSSSAAAATTTTTLEIETELLRTVHETFVIIPNQIRIMDNFKLKIDNVFNKEIKIQKQRRRKSETSLMDSLAKVTNHNVVLYDYYKSKIKLQNQQIKKCVNEIDNKIQSKFNSNPTLGIMYASKFGYIQDATSPNDVARFLFYWFLLLTGGEVDERGGEGGCHNNKTSIGEYLGRGEQYRSGFAIQVLDCYVNLFDFKGLQYDDAIRYFLSGFKLPGEAQKIDRIMEKFAKRYTYQNPDVFHSVDVAFIVAFAVIMLNTDLHNPAMKQEKKMTKDGFILNVTRGINSTCCDDDDDDDDDHDRQQKGLIPRDLLGSIYDRIKTNQIQLD